jgi:hypothetical protein
LAANGSGFGGARWRRRCAFVGRWIANDETSLKYRPMMRGWIIVGTLLAANMVLVFVSPPLSSKAETVAGTGRTFTLPSAEPDRVPQKGEMFIAADKNPLAAGCAKDAFDPMFGLFSDPKPKLLRIAVTQSPKWGTIWRADLKVPGWTAFEPPSFVRAVCWDDRTNGRMTTVFVEPKIPGVSSGKWCMGPVPRAVSAPSPRTYKDVRTDILFYVESDGQHLAALGADGKVLWVRNPFVNRDMCPYRVLNPHIVFLKAADPREADSLSKIPQMHIDRRDKFLSIGFDSSQFGIVDEKTGDFFPEGQN